MPKIDRTLSLAIVLGAIALVAPLVAPNDYVVGVLVGLYYTQIDFFMGYSAGLKAFTAAVLGGIGNLKGAMLGGIVLGLLEAFAASYMSLLTGGAFGAEYKDIFAFSVLILILIFRPKGLLGEVVRERA